MYLTLFLTFFKIGLFTIGGGYAMIPLIERDILRRQWLTREEFLDLLALTQTLPGIFAVNISIFIGHRLRRLPGAITCALGTILPSFLIILAIALFFQRFQDNPYVIRAFAGIRPAVVALILVPCITAARSLRLTPLQLILPLAAALLIWLAGLSPVYVILAGILGGILYTRIIIPRIKNKKP